MRSDGVGAYSVAHSWVRAAYSRMLVPETWAQLCAASGFGALLTLLQGTDYGPFLGQVEDRNLTPRRALYQIRSHLADRFTQVIRLVPEYARPLLTQLYRLYEVDNLKAILRGLVAGAPWEQVRYVLFPLGPLTVLPVRSMAEAQSVEAAVELLRETPYHYTLAHAMERYAAERSLFPLEVALDLDYWRGVWQDITRLAGRDREQALRIVGSLVDMTNLMWAIRYRVYHGLSEEEIINYTMPFGYRVRDQDIRAIAAQADIAQVIAPLYPGFTDVDSLLHQPNTGLAELELRLQRQIAERCRAAFLGYPFHIGIPLAFVVLNELEVQDLTVLVEAKSMQLPAEAFAPHLLFGCTPGPSQPT